MKVNKEIEIEVLIPGHNLYAKVTVDYDSIWSYDGNTWKFQTWCDWAKVYINVHGRFNKDGRMSVYGLKAFTSFTEQGGWRLPAANTYMRKKVLSIE